MKLESLKDLYIEQLKDLYSAEEATDRRASQDGRAGRLSRSQERFHSHLRQTEEQLRRLEQILQDLGESPKGHTCEG